MKNGDTYRKYMSPISGGKPELVDSHAHLDMAEFDAVTRCVEAFSLFRPQKSLRVHVPWCENDYQIDVATPEGRADDAPAAFRCGEKAAKVGLTLGQDDYPWTMFFYGDHSNHCGIVLRPYSGGAVGHRALPPPEWWGNA